MIREHGRWDSRVASSHPCTITLGTLLLSLLFFSSFRRPLPRDRPHPPSSLERLLTTMACKGSSSCGSSCAPPATTPAAAAASTTATNNDSKAAESRRRQGVEEYYGSTLQATGDLKTAACCSSAERPSARVRAALGRIHAEVSGRYYGCGLVSPPVLAGCRVLDLGCGTGRDVYLLAQLVGANGHVVGVDMTEAQLAIAREYEEHHREAFGYAKSNVSFVQGTLEELDSLGLEPASFDVIVRCECGSQARNGKPRVRACLHQEEMRVGSRV